MLAIVHFNHDYCTSFLTYLCSTSWNASHTWSHPSLEQPCKMGHRDQFCKHSVMCRNGYGGGDGEDNQGSFFWPNPGLCANSTLICKWNDHTDLLSLCLGEDESKRLRTEELELKATWNGPHFSSRIASWLYMSYSPIPYFWISGSQNEYRDPPVSCKLISDGSQST